MKLPAPRLAFLRDVTETSLKAYLSWSWHIETCTLSCTDGGLEEGSKVSSWLVQGLRTSPACLLAASRKIYEVQIYCRLREGWVFNSFEIGIFAYPFLSGLSRITSYMHVMQCMPPNRSWTIIILQSSPMPKVFINNARSAARRLPLLAYQPVLQA